MLGLESQIYSQGQPKKTKYLLNSIFGLVQKVSQQQGKMGNRYIEDEFGLVGSRSNSIWRRNLIQSRGQNDD
jgi:hypothetical protein